MSVKVTSILVSSWLPKKEAELDVAVLRMATDIDRQAKILAPKASRALVNSSRITREKSAHYTVSFGGGSVAYALIRHYINKKNPGTLKYLERSGDNVSKNVRKYL